MGKREVQIIEDHLNRVWNERNPEKRLKALEEIYTHDANLNHVGNKVTGLDAINSSITKVLNDLPSELEFIQLKPIVINNNIGRAIWSLGSAGETPVQTGMDIAILENNKIKSLYVFLD